MLGMSVSDGDNIIDFFFLQKTINWVVHSSYAQ